MLLSFSILNFKISWSNNYTRTKQKEIKYNLKIGDKGQMIPWKNVIFFSVEKRLQINKFS